MAPPRQPMPRSAAWTAVSGLETATQSGGCGFCTGLGRMGRSGIEKYLPSQENRSWVHIFGIACTASSHISFVRSGSQRKPPSSVQVAERPGANSRRPPGRGWRGGALGRAGRVVEVRQHDGDALPDANALRAGSRGGEKDLGRGAVRVLLEEVVLDGP